MEPDRRPPPPSSSPPPSPAEDGRGPDPARLVRAGLVFYGLMAAAAVVWRVGFQRAPLLYSDAATPGGLADAARDAGLGLVAGLATVAVSAVLTRATRWGENLARELAGALGPLGVPDAILLAFASGFAEEALFRGALQPVVGLLPASVLFGAVHFVPRREFLPWTAFAVVAGFGLGALYEWTGSLVAPIVAHTVVNAVNLPWLVRRYGARRPT